MRSRIGPLTMMSGAEKCVEVATLCRLKAGSQAHSAAASTTGRYSGRHDGGDGGFLDAESAVVRRQLAEQFVARSSGSREHPLDPLAGRRHDGERVGRALLRTSLHILRGVAR